MHRAAEFAKLEVLMWAVRHGCPWDSESCAQLVADSEYDDEEVVREVVQWIYEWIDEHVNHGATAE